MQKKYEVIAIVGEGAYGIVYKCKNKEKVHPNMDVRYSYTPCKHKFPKHLLQT